MSIKIFPHSMGSQGATALAGALGVSKVYPDRNYRPRRSHIILNWGNGSTPQWMPTAQGNQVRFLNSIQSVALAQNKLSTLMRLRDENVPVPVFTTDRAEAQGWLEQGHRIYCRTLLRASEGRGITVVGTATGDRDYEFMEHELVDAPLYTQGIHGNRREYRLHVFDERVISSSRKQRLTSENLEERDIETRGSLIRNSSNGYIYGRLDTDEVALAIRQVARQAVNVLGLDFGAVDIIATRSGIFVLEINTAPGIEGATLEAYTAALREVTANV